MLLTKEVEMKWVNRNKSHYIDKGYTFTNYGDIFKVKVDDLPKGSHETVKVKCDGKNCENPYLQPITWHTYLNNVTSDGKYFCKKCAIQLFASKEMQKTKLKNGKSFKQWCIENNRQDVLDRWDYELNKCNPDEINYSTKEKYYFKCLRGIHNSELKLIADFTNGIEGSISCKACNSFAQWGIDNLGVDFLERYWDFKKNKTKNPWNIAAQHNAKVWIKCQEKDYHGSYNIVCSDFFKGRRCPYCSNAHGKVHLLDSLGTLCPESLKTWSNKNKKSPFEYSPCSSQEVYWKCPNGKHKDFKRQIYISNKICDFRCPECYTNSLGEDTIVNYLNIKNINYIPQKTFPNCKYKQVLQFDFYLPNYNICIEYQGKQHYEPVDFAGKGEKWAEKQFNENQKKDTIKRDYCKLNNIDLLEISYWDFDNIEQILGTVLHNYKYII